MLEIKQLFDTATSTYTYVLWDDVTRGAALIDPVNTQVVRDSKLIRELNLNLKYLLELPCQDFDLFIPCENPVLNYITSPMVFKFDDGSLEVIMPMRA